MDSKEFKEIRIKIGSQFKVANLLGVSQGQVSIWEMGYKPIPDDVAEKLRSEEKVLNG